MNYRPILRFKRGEQTALANLEPSQKAAIKPLVNLVAHGFNPPDGLLTDSAFDQRIRQDADRLKSVWASYPVNVDLGDIEPDAQCDGVIHPVKYFFDRLYADNNCPIASPVLRAGSDDRYIAAVAAVCAEYGSVPAFRITPDDLAEVDIDDAIQSMLFTCGVRAADAEFIIDMGYISTTGRSILTARGALTAVPFVEDWAALTLVAGSFPESLSEFAIGPHTIERHEWDVWLANRSLGARPLLYGDYVTLHPIPIEDGIDPALMNPSASLRYAVGSKWILLRGQGTRTRGGQGYNQFFTHADKIVTMPEYRGEDFSFGDRKIMKIHRREENHGNLETWVTIAVSHHIAEIVDQLASLPSPLT